MTINEINEIYSKEYLSSLEYLSSRKRQIIVGTNGNFPFTPWWFTGITDAKGNFSINLIEKRCNCVFEIILRSPSTGILYDFQRYFKCGEVVLVNKKYKIYKFIVTRNEDLYNNILPHFDKYPLVTSKNLDYLDFKKVVFMRKDRLDLFDIHRREITFIKNNINKRSFEERYHFYEDLDIKKLDYEWILAFIDGRGVFDFGVYKQPKSNGLECDIFPNLFLILTKDEIKLIDYLENFLGICFYKKYNSIKDTNDIQEIKSRKSQNIWCPFFDSDSIIKFINDYPMFTSNALDYEYWNILIRMNNSGVASTLLGSGYMWKIKKRMYSNGIITRIPDEIYLKDYRVYLKFYREYIKHLSNTIANYNYKFRV